MTTPAGLWAPVAAPSPPVSKVQNWIDVSNYQGYLGDAWFTAWSALGYGGLIVQAVWDAGGNTYTRGQLQSALDHNWAIAGYIWVSYKQASNMQPFNNKLHLFDGHRLEFLALDIEELQMDLADVNAALKASDVYLGRPADVWIYTQRRLFVQYGWQYLEPWPDRKLWFALYDGNPDVGEGFVPFCGWTQAEMKQFTDTPLDQNVRRI